MKTTNFLSWMIAVLIITGTSSCSKTEFFKSESKVEDQLQGSWSLIPIPRTNPAETWIFTDGIVYRQKGVGFGTEPMPYDTGTFTVNTSMTKVQVKIDNFHVVLDELNGNWQVVTLNDEFLIMATDHDGATGIMQREFQKRK
ncbi:MAG: hypothetical protein KA444_10495 [Bacteroidia bacterium]|nr:hypothetical protein [Bacteroidia bacterium]